MDRWRCHAVCVFRSRLRVMHLTSTLIYLVGASGSGKDSLLAHARSRLCAQQEVIFAHRYITRAASVGGENHIALSNAEFELRRQAGLLAMHWESHGYCYGVGIEINHWLAKGMTVSSMDRANTWRRRCNSIRRFDLSGLKSIPKHCARGSRRVVEKVQRKSVRASRDGRRLNSVTVAAM